MTVTQPLKDTNMELITMTKRYYGSVYYRVKYASPKARWAAAYSWVRYYVSQNFTAENPD